MKPIESLSGDQNRVGGLSDAQIQEAISLGQRYGNVEKLWNKEFKRTNRLKMSGYWSWSGSKYLTVFIDRVRVAMAAAKAAHEMPGSSTLRMRSSCQA